MNNSTLYILELCYLILSFVTNLNLNYIKNLIDELTCFNYRHHELGSNRTKKSFEQKSHNKGDK